MTEKILIDRSVVEQALKVLEYAANDVLTGRNVAETLRVALEQPQVEQEPVGFVRQIDIEQIAKTPSDWGAMFGRVMGFNTVPVYTRPHHGKSSCVH